MAGCSLQGMAEVPCRAGSYPVQSQHCSHFYSSLLAAESSPGCSHWLGHPGVSLFGDKAICRLYSWQAAFPLVVCCLSSQPGHVPVPCPYKKLQMCCDTLRWMQQAQGLPGSVFTLSVFLVFSYTVTLASNLVLRISLIDLTHFFKEISLELTFTA